MDLYKTGKAMLLMAGLQAAITLAAGFGIGGVVFVACAAALKMDELKQAIGMLRRKTRKA